MKKTALKRSGPLARTRKTPAAKAKARATKLWGEYVHARDKVCQFCGKADGKLDAHHVLIRSFNATRTDEANGLLLCFHHHALMHDDPMIAVTFYTNQFGVDGYRALREKAYEGRHGKYPTSFWVDECARLAALLESL